MCILVLSAFCICKEECAYGPLWMKCQTTLIESMLLLTIKKVFDKSKLVSYDAGETSLIVSDCTPGLQLPLSCL